MSSPPERRTSERSDPSAGRTHPCRPAPNSACRTSPTRESELCSEAAASRADSGAKPTCLIWPGGKRASAFRGARTLTLRANQTKETANAYSNKSRQHGKHPLADRARHPECRLGRAGPVKDRAMGGGKQARRREVDRPGEARQREADARPAPDHGAGPHEGRGRYDRRVRAREPLARGGHQRGRGCAHRFPHRPPLRATSVFREAGGIVGDLRGMVSTGLRAVRTRLELLAIELGEEKEWAVRFLAIAVTALYLVTFGILLAIFALVLSAAEENRPAILASFAAVFLVCGGAGVAYIVAASKRRSPLFADTIAVPKGDEKALQEGLRGTGD